MVLYEVLTGRRALERNLPKTEQKLLDWVKQFPAESRKFSMIMDPRLQNNYSNKASRELARLANNCLLKNPKDRPSMSQVVEKLNDIIRISEEGSPSGSSFKESYEDEPD